MSAAGSARLALVTGGCRRVGAAIAAELARSGWALALHGRSDAVPDAELAEVLAECETHWHGFTADLGQASAPAKLIAAVIAHFGRAPDLLVNNASLFDYDDLASLTPKMLTDHFAVNTFAPVLLARDLVAAAGEGAQPAIVQIIDQRVRNPNGDQLSYTLSKQALAESIRTLARAFGPSARVNGVAPGLTLATSDYDDAQMARLAARMPLGRLSTPQDIARAVRYLADEPAITGQLLFVDGGAHMLSLDRDFVFLDKQEEA
ncbi:short chain dehydrogenase family protein [Blastomonas sp. RAC04]|uniref:SDR family oxidoreductase n=2 Tax=Blastomonas TaxID=150203 RepID=UPI00083D4DE8|nr:SDR family oxidoreductase [Blastomonas sp. RAC04]AOG01695.1 short chain dehydrogenase family protein [Blastomonas sp. RAC04]